MSERTEKMNKYRKSRTRVLTENKNKTTEKKIDQIEDKTRKKKSVW